MLIANLVVLTTDNAAADTSPPPGTPATVSADSLPTVQIDGVIRAQVTVGNTVYATGQFSQARPAGVALGGPGTVARDNLLAYDITTGQLSTSFVHSLGGPSAEGRAIAASPDGRRLYVGGKFTEVDGQPRSNLAVFDLTTDQLMGGFTGTSSIVRAIAATDSQLFIGGSFHSAGGQTRVLLASYNANGALNPNWRPSVTGFRAQVSALTIAQGKLIVGGTFNNIGGTTFYSIGAVALATGVPVKPWATSDANFPIRNQIKTTAATTSGAQISSLSTDGHQVFFTSWAYGSPDLIAAFEGRASISAIDGRLLWANDCFGDSHSAIPISGILYSASHAHNCAPMGAFPGSAAKYRALAETTTPSGTNVAPGTPKHINLAGIKRTTQLAWYPDISHGTYTGTYEGAWSVTGNATYLSYGGEFIRANGKPQQGLVRYALTTVAPNKVAPNAYSGPAVDAATANGRGVALVSWPSTWDKDNARLTYRLYRDGGTTPIHQTTVDSRFWARRYMSFVDTGLAPHSTHSYRVVVSDPFGNSTATATPAITFTKVANWSNYACRDSAHACVNYHMEIRRDQASGRYYAWSAMVTAPPQAGKVPITEIRIDGLNLGTPNGLLARGGPFTTHHPVVYGQTPAAANPSGARVQARLYYTVRYADGAVMTRSTGLLVAGQHN